MNDPKIKFSQIIFLFSFFQAMVLFTHSGQNYSSREQLEEFGVSQHFGELEWSKSGRNGG
jgi:hypothetical protein